MITFSKFKGTKYNPESLSDLFLHHTAKQGEDWTLSPAILSTQTGLISQQQLSTMTQPSTVGPSQVICYWKHVKLANDGLLFIRRGCLHKKSISCSFVFRNAFSSKRKWLPGKKKVQGFDKPKGVCLAYECYLSGESWWQVYCITLPLWSMTMFPPLYLPL